MATVAELSRVRPAPRIVRHTSALGSWEMVRTAPHPAVAGLVGGYCGYTERTPWPLRRREVASRQITLIISFGDRIRLLPHDGVTVPGETVSFVAGLHNGPTVTEHDGVQAGVQIDLSPLGAYTLLGLPMSELADRVVPFEDVWETLGGGLPDRLASAPGWPERFALLDALWLRRLADGPVPRPEVARSWELLESSHGGVGVAELAEEVGWSRRHLTARFREQVGLPPKQVALLFRFRRAVALLRAPGPDLAAVATACGYYDQAHFNRDFRMLAGCTPTAYLAARLPDEGGVAG